MTRCLVRFAGASLTGFVLACHGKDAETAAPQTAPVARQASAQVERRGFPQATAQSMQALARALAEGLNTPSARSALYSELMESEFFQNSLHLHALFSRARGRSILDNAARRRGIDVGALETVVRNLPDLDLYIPDAVHRQAWTADAPIGVAALVDEFSPIFAYLGSGDSVFIDRTSRQPPSIAVLLLAPLEHKALRRRRSMVSVEGDTLWECLVVGPERRAQDCGGGGGGGYVNSAYLHLDILVVENVCDNGLCWLGEGNEFEFRATAAGGSEYSPVLRCEGVPSSASIQVATFGCVGSDKVHSSYPGQVPYLDVAVVETDGWPNPDDRFMTYIFPTSGCQSPPRISSDNFATHASRLLWQVPHGLGYRGVCNPYGPDPFSWVEVRFRWP